MTTLPPTLTGRVSAVVNRCAHAIEEWSALDRPAEAIGRLRPVLRRSRTVTDALSGSAFGHPLHPVLVTLPIGSWSAALVLDLLGQRRAARTLVGLGVLTAVPAVSSGGSDWLDTTGAARRVGLVHVAANDLALLLWGASWLLRRRGRHTAGLLVAVPAMGAVGLAGWLGGHLSYARGVGVDTGAFDPEHTDWVGVTGEADVLALRPRLVTVGRAAILVVRDLDGRLHAVSGRCPHRGESLETATVEDGAVRCPWHGCLFSLDGDSVLHGPATRPLRRYDVSTADGRVLVRASAP